MTKRLETRSELIPNEVCRQKWEHIMHERWIATGIDREHRFQFGNGYLHALLDAGILNHANRTELREVLISPREL